jgi:hypothetical protein
MYAIFWGINKDMKFNKKINLLWVFLTLAQINSNFTSDTNKTFMNWSNMANFGYVAVGFICAKYLTGKQKGIVEKTKAEFTIKIKNNKLVINNINSCIPEYYDTVFKVSEEYISSNNFIQPLNNQNKNKNNIHLVNSQIAKLKEKGLV